MIKAILMDWNGVVINDEQVQCDAYKSVFEEHGVELTDEGYYARMGMNDRAFTASVFEEAGKPDRRCGDGFDDRSEKREMARERRKGRSAFPGRREFR
jgi:beta-phosphoglucomutase-like phosphatase (HAD superfamily)